MKLLKDRSNMLYVRGSGIDIGSCILNQLQFLEEFVRKTREDRVSQYVM